MKKKWLCVGLAAAMVFSLTACGGSDKTETTAATTAPATETSEAETKAEGETDASEAAGTEMPSFEGQQLRISTFSFNAELVQKNI